MYSSAPLSATGTGQHGSNRPNHDASRRTVGADPDPEDSTHMTSPSQPLLLPIAMPRPLPQLPLSQGQRPPTSPPLQTASQPSYSSGIGLLPPLAASPTGSTASTVRPSQPFANNSNPPIHAQLPPQPPTQASGSQGGGDPRMPPTRTQRLRATCCSLLIGILIALCIIQLTAGPGSDRSQLYKQLLAETNEQRALLDNALRFGNVSFPPVWELLPQSTKDFVSHWIPSSSPDPTAGPDAGLPVHHTNLSGYYQGLLKPPSPLSYPLPSASLDFNVTSLGALAFIYIDHPSNLTSAQHNATMLAKLRVGLKNITSPGQSDFVFYGSAIVTSKGSLFGMVSASSRINATTLLGALPADLVNRTLAIPPLMSDLDQFRAQVQTWLESMERGPKPDSPDKVTNCTWFVFAQPQVPSGMTWSELDAIYDEYRSPRGMFDRRLPPLDAHWVMVSHDCQVTLATTTIGDDPYQGELLTGVADVVVAQRMSYLAVLYVVMAVVKFGVTMKHMDWNTSPSHLMRFSWPSLAFQLIIDCYYAFVYLLSALAQDELMLTYLTAGFVELMHTMLFSWRLLAHVLQAQNSRLASIRIRPVWFLPFYIMVFGFNMLQILLYDSAPFPPLFGVPLFAAFSYPALQIARSAYMSVTPRTSILLSLLATATRLFFPAYLVLCPANLYTFGHTGKPYIPWLHLILGWIGMQYLIMVTQRLPFLGASWFVPRKWRLVSYDYRMSVDEVEAHLREHEHDVEQIPLGDGADGGGAMCSICMCVLVEEGQDVQVVARELVRTPCEHVFHAECLRPWLEQRLQCPTCRAVVPAMV